MSGATGAGGVAGGGSVGYFGGVRVGVRGFDRGGGGEQRSGGVSEAGGSGGSGYVDGDHRDSDCAARRDCGAGAVLGNYGYRSGGGGGSECAVDGDGGGGGERGFFRCGDASGFAGCGSCGQ